MRLDSGSHHDFLIDIISALKVHAHTRNPGRPSRALLRPLSERTIGFSPVAWALSIVLLFGTAFLIAPLLILCITASALFGFTSFGNALPTVTLLISVLKILSVAFLDISISLLRISPLGATALIGYFMLVIVLWCMFLPH